MTVHRRHVIAGTLATVAAPFVARPAFAQQSVSLTIVSGFAPVTGIVKQLKESLIPEVNKRVAASNIKINWTEGFAGTIAKPGGELDAIRTGLADIGIVVLPLHTDKVPGYRFSFSTPFGTTDLAYAVKLHDQIVQKYPALRDVWGRFGQRFLGSSSLPDNYQVLLRRPIQKPQELSGKKIVGIGPNLRWVQPLGAVGVVSSMADFYSSLQTGVADGAMIWPEVILSLKLSEVANFMFKGDLGAAVSYALTINENTWKRLPPQVQQALQEAAPVFGEALARYQMAFGPQAEQKLKEAGGQAFQVPQADRVTWAKALPNIAQEWAKEVEAQGIPGNAILADWMDGLRASGAPVARNWDKE